MENKQPFQISSCHWLGFDLDHTLIRYNVPALEKLEFDSFIEFFVKQLKYPEELQDAVFDEKYCFRGIVTDLDTGNTLKLDSDKIVIKGYHGSRQLTNEEISTLYPDPLNFNGAHTDQYWSVSTFFEAGVGPLWVALVDLFEKSSEPVSYRNILADMRKALDYNFYSFPNGYFFPSIVTNPEKYLFKRDSIVQWLKDISSADASPKPIRLFLLTNSDTNYAAFLAKYCLGNDWEQLFDLVIYFGRKPSFWSTDAMFQRVILRSEGDNYSFENIQDVTIDTKLGKHYRLGNGAHLTEFFESTIPEGETLQVCYVGDHLTGDCMHCKITMNWHIIAIVEELEHQHGNHVPLDDIHTECNEVWGSYFSTIHETSIQKKTFWCDLICNHVDLAIPCLSSLTEIPLDYKHDNTCNHILSPCAIFQHSTSTTTRSMYYSPITENK